MLSKVICCSHSYTELILQHCNEHNYPQKDDQLKTDIEKHRQRKAQQLEWCSYNKEMLISILLTRSLKPTCTHLCRCVSFCGFRCVLYSLTCAQAPFLIVLVHMPRCHRQRGVVSIFLGPFLGDNDDHFFCSVTDDRQN